MFWFVLIAYYSGILLLLIVPDVGFDLLSPGICF